MDFRIRPLAHSDEKFIYSVLTRFSEFNLPPWRTREDLDGASYATLKEAMENPKDGSAMFIAEDAAGQPAGFIHLQVQTDYFTGEKHGHISDLAVDAAFEGMGVGRMLLGAAEDWALEQGFRLLTLYVFEGNAHAQQVYEKNGFSREVVKYVKVLG